MPAIMMIQPLPELTAGKYVLPSVVNLFMVHLAYTGTKFVRVMSSCPLNASFRICANLALLSLLRNHRIYTYPC